MFVNVIWLIAFTVLTALAVRFFIKAVRSSRAPVRFGAGFFVGLFTVLFALITVLGLLGILTAYSPRGNPIVEVQVEGTTEQVERGRQLASWTCTGCHTVDKNLPLSGGEDLFTDIPMPIGNATAPNLTPAGRISTWSDGELQRAIREGTSPDGHLMPMMSSNTFRYLSQEDLDSIVAYLRSEPAVETEIEQKNKLTYLAMVMLPIGMLPVKDVPDFDPPPHVEPAVTAVYGEYLVKVFDCAICHGDDFSGGPGGLLPVGPSLAGAKTWTTDQFITTMRTGETPYGTTLSEDMPWEEIGKMDDGTLEAVLLYLKEAAP